VKPQSSNHLLAEPLFGPKFPAWAIIVLFLIVSPLLRAVDLPPPYTVDLPFGTNQATPIWLGHPEVPPRTFATLNLPIQPPDPTASLLVTIFFQEKEGGFLRINWQGAQSAQVLSDNFYEGIAMRNQRSLLVSPETMRDSGALSFQCGDTALVIQRIRLEWLENRDGLVSSKLRDIQVTPEVGATQPASILNGQPNSTAPAAWHGQIVTVPITEAPERIEQGVEYNVQLDDPPGLARLALKETGLPWGRHIVVWLNQKRAGIVTPAVPDLLDAGFFAQTNLSTSYVGWRDVSAYVPVALLKTGINTVQFSDEDDVLAPNGNSGDFPTGAASPLAIKNVVLQLSYPSVPSTSTVLSSNTPSDVSSLPTTSADSSSPPTSPTPSLPTASTPPETNTP
jgi:hypothetical protein